MAETMAMITGIGSAVLKSDLFAKSNLYANSKVPRQLIPNCEASLVDKFSRRIHY